MESRLESKFAQLSAKFDSSFASIDERFAEITKQFEGIGDHHEASLRRQRIWLTIAMIVTSAGGLALQKFLL